MEEYRRYLQRMLKNNSLIVDTIAVQFSAQKLFEDCLKKPVPFAYWGVHAFGNQHIYKKMGYSSLFNATPLREPQIFTKNWDIMEFLITSIEPPIMNLNEGVPTYMDNVSEFELFRNHVYQFVSKGEVDFAAQVKKVFGEMVPKLSKEFAVEWINSFLDNFQDEDRQYLKDLHYAIDSGHQNFLPMFNIQ